MHFRCAMHMEDNIKSELSSLGFAPAVGREYMADIFGREGDADLSTATMELNLIVVFKTLRPSGKRDMRKAMTFISTL